MDSIDIEKAIIERQLGRKIDEDYAICTKCFWNLPSCISTLPILGGKPFPTIHWLTCPYLRREISVLEERGLIKHIQRKLETEACLMEAYLSAHRTTASIIEEKLRKLDPAEWIFSSFRGRGIGGIRNFASVKCLHLHVANLLCGVDNPVGKMVLGMLKTTECEGGILCERSDKLERKPS